MRTFSEEHKVKIGKALKGRIMPDEVKGKISMSLMGRERPEEVRKKISLTHKTRQVNLGRKISEETKLKLRQANLGKKLSEETKQKLQLIGKGRIVSNETKIKMSLSKKGKTPWNKGIPMSPAQLKKVMLANSVKPNKLEVLLGNMLDEWYPNEFKFVGDGQVVIGGKCPDFINVNGKKLIIELFGDYWHRNDNPEERIKIFEPYGFKAIVIWEKELKNIPLLYSKLQHFIKEEVKN